MGGVAIEYYVCKPSVCVCFFGGGGGGLKGPAACLLSLGLTLALVTLKGVGGGLAGGGLGDGPCDLGGGYRWFGWWWALVVALGP